MTTSTFHIQLLCGLSSTTLTLECQQTQGRKNFMSDKREREKHGISGVKIPEHQYNKSRESCAVAQPTTKKRKEI